VSQLAPQGHTLDFVVGITGRVDGANDCYQLLHFHLLELDRSKGGGNCNATGPIAVFRVRDTARNSGDLRHGAYVRRDVFDFSSSAILLVIRCSVG